MKRLLGAALFFLVLFAGPGAAPAAPATPRRIMSLTVCTDELLMDLVPPERIVSLSYLSREKPVLKVWPEAARIAVNHNSLEEVLAARPDLVLTLNYASPHFASLLRASGISFLQVPQAENFAQIRAILRKVGDAVGAHTRAETLIAHMDAEMRKLDATRPKKPIRVAAWGGGGFVPGEASLFDAVLELAGGVSITRNDAYYDVESLLQARPDIIAYGDDYIDSPSLRQDQNAHPAILKWFANRRVTYPAAAAFNCGLPQSVDAAKALRAAMLQAMAKPGGVP